MALSLPICTYQTGINYRKHPVSTFRVNYLYGYQENEPQIWGINADSLIGENLR